MAWLETAEWITSEVYYREDKLYTHSNENPSKSGEFGDEYSRWITKTTKWEIKVEETPGCLTQEAAERIASSQSDAVQAQVIRANDAGAYRVTRTTETMIKEETDDPLKKQ